MLAYVARDKDDTLWLCSSEPVFLDDEIGMVAEFYFPLSDADYPNFRDLPKGTSRRAQIIISVCHDSQILNSILR